MSFAGASGNVATEDVLQLLEGLGVTRRIMRVFHILPKLFSHLCRGGNGH